eukprot:2975469-Amphidinium_carterae.1
MQHSSSHDGVQLLPVVAQLRLASVTRFSLVALLVAFSHQHAICLLLEIASRNSNSLALVPRQGDLHRHPSARMMKRPLLYLVASTRRWLLLHTSQTILPALQHAMSAMRAQYNYYQFDLIKRFFLVQSTVIALY